MPRILVFALVLAAGLAFGAELKIGLIPEQNVFKQTERYQPLGEYLTRKTGLKFRFTILPRYGNVIDRFRQESLDGAFFGSFVGALAIEKLGIVPHAMYFGLLLGASIGGNITPIGASANIVAMGILKKQGYRVRFMEFVRIGFPFTVASVTVSSLFIWLVFG